MSSSVPNATNGGAHFSNSARETFVSAEEAQPHVSVEPVNNLEIDDLESQIEYQHDSEFATGSFAPLAEKGYRSSRSDIKKLQKDLRYGQYLSVPKGRRTIFASHVRSQDVITVLKVAALVVVMGIVAYIIWGFIG